MQQKIKTDNQQPSLVVPEKLGMSDAKLDAKLDPIFKMLKGQNFADEGAFIRALFGVIAGQPEHTRHTILVKVYANAIAEVEKRETFHLGKSVIATDALQRLKAAANILAGRLGFESLGEHHAAIQGSATTFRSRLS